MSSDNSSDKKWIKLPFGILKSLDLEAPAKGEDDIRNKTKSRIVWNAEYGEVRLLFRHPALLFNSTYPSFGQCHYSYWFRDTLYILHQGCIQPQ
jgi:hypothetical protein